MHIGTRPEPSRQPDDRADILFAELGAQTGAVLASKRASPEATPLERGRERLAAGLLVTHQIWFLLWIGASLVSGLIYCEGDDACEGGWAFGWGMLWAVGEMVLFIPATLSTLYLVVRFFRGSTAAPLVGLGSWAALIGILLVGSVFWSG